MRQARLKTEEEQHKKQASSFVEGRILDEIEDEEAVSMLAERWRRGETIHATRVAAADNYLPE